MKNKEKLETIHIKVMYKTEMIKIKFTSLIPWSVKKKMISEINARTTVKTFFIKVQINKDKQLVFCPKVREIHRFKRFFFFKD